MKKNRILLSLTLLSLLVFLASCATTTVHDVWKNETYEGMPFNKILVIAVLQDVAVKSRFEDEFLAQLKIHQADSIASYSSFFHYMTVSKKTVTSSIEQPGADSILIVRLFNPKKEKAYSAGGKFIVPEWYYDLYSYFSRCFGYMQVPGYVEENDYVIMEVNLYDAKEQKLLWSGRSEVLTFVCGCQEIKEYIKVMIDRLASDRFIKPIEDTARTGQKSS